jgi:preprotein translocase subunit SecG
MLQTALNTAQIIFAVLLIISIVLQARGSGLGAIFGGEGNVYRAKRGVEKILFVSTIVIAILFFVTAIANIFLKG